VGDEETHAAVSPRPPNRSTTIVARTEGYAHAANVLGGVSRSAVILCRPAPNPTNTSVYHGWGGCAAGDIGGGEHDARAMERRVNIFTDGHVCVSHVHRDHSLMARIVPVRPSPPPVYVSCS
jgi:hypothetical protein